METFLNRYRNITVLLLVIFAQLVLLALQVKNDQDVRMIRVWTVSAVTPVARVVDGVRGGSIVNVGSAAGHKPMPNGAHYGATKAAVESLTRSWAMELAPFGIKGWVRLKPFTAAPETLLEFKSWWLASDENKAWTRYRVVEAL